MGSRLRFTPRFRDGHNYPLAYAVGLPIYAIALVITCRITPTGQWVFRWDATVRIIILNFLILPVEVILQEKWRSTRPRRAVRRTVTRLPFHFHRWTSALSVRASVPRTYGGSTPVPRVPTARASEALPVCLLGLVFGPLTLLGLFWLWRQAMRSGRG